jgi:hypothetical protein
MSLLHHVVLPALTVVGLGFLIACSSSNNSTPPPSGGFTNSDFNGTYTFAVSGSDTSSDPVAIAGTITACGCSNGQITAGTVDNTDVGFGLPITANGSGYKVNANGTGTFTLTLPVSTGGTVQYQFAFVLTDAAHGLVSEYDQNGTGSGTIDLQPSAVTLSNTSYAFTFSGAASATSGIESLGAVGAFTLNSSGGITAGLADFNFGGAPATQQTLSGAVSVGTGTAPGTASFSSSFASSQAFDVYAIDATHLKFIESDGKAVLVGDVFSQPTATIPQATLVFTMAGLDTTNSSPTGLAGTVISDGSSQLGSGSVDVNDGGEVDNGTNPATPFGFNGTFVAEPGGNANGRFFVDLSSFPGGTDFVAYPSSGGVLMLEIDSGLGAGVTAGVALAQNSPAGLVASQGYGMNLTGESESGELDQIAQFNTTSSSATGELYQNTAGVTTSTGFSGTITPGTGGGGQIIFNGNQEGAFYYGVDSATSLALGIDTSDVSLGMFQQQGSPTSTTDVAGRHLAMIKAAVKARAKKKKQL